jgi:hypothetical protein
VYVAPDILFLFLAAYWSYKFSDWRISFWKTTSGALYMKGRIIIYLIYLAGLIARLMVDFLVIGQSVFSFSSGTTTPLSQSALLAATLTDLLIMFGVGLLIRRDFSIYKRYKLIAEGKEQVPAAPQEVQKNSM